MSERVVLTVKKPEVNRDNSDSRMRRGNHSRSVNPSVDRILFLQKTVGNQAVQRLLRSGTLQAKLRIGQPGDVYEQEADRVADEVMQMEDSHVKQQVEPEGEEIEELIQTKPLAEQIAPLAQRQLKGKENEIFWINESSGQTQVAPNLESRIHAIRDRGQPLPESTRAFFEPRFGFDLSRVRVHTNQNAAEISRAIHARAFTTGWNIVFGASEYAPESHKGRQLLAHELTHLAQQNGSQSQRAPF
jgi:hypothetical protein